MESGAAQPRLDHFAETTDFLDVSQAAVSKAEKNLQIHAVKDVVLKDAQRIADCSGLSGRRG